MATTAHCNSCGYQFDCPDSGSPDMPVYVASGPCPSCGSSAIGLDRCDGCPVTDLAFYRANSAAGRLLDRILDLDFASKHFRVDWSEVTVEEVHGLQVLEQERTKKQIEDQQSAKEKWEAEQAMAAMRAKEGRMGGR